jgi:hypothetical protein
MSDIKLGLMVILIVQTLSTIGMIYLIGSQS